MTKAKLLTSAASIIAPKFSLAETVTYEVSGFDGDNCFVTETIPSSSTTYGISTNYFKWVSSVRCMANPYRFPIYRCGALPSWPMT